MVNLNRKVAYELLESPRRFQLIQGELREHWVRHDRLFIGARPSALGVTRSPRCHAQDHILVNTTG
jgi:hypothetical protein